MTRSPTAPVSRTFKRALAGAWIAASFAMVGTARADIVKSFTWTFDGYTATGSLTVEDTPSVGTFRLITGLTGFVNGDAMTLLPPDVFPGNANSDNLLDIDAGELSYNGVSWESGGKWWNIYWDPITHFAVCRGEVNSPDGCDDFFDGSRFELSTPVATVPTPATLPLLAIGALAMGVTRRGAGRRFSREALPTS